jgi:hypothetical protein
MDPALRSRRDAPDFGIRLIYVKFHVHRVVSACESDARCLG